jgi:MFS family permease
MTFAGCLLLFGRLSDCLTASYIFISGFASMAVLSLILSFVTNKYAFLVIRALSGIAGASTIPSAIQILTR